MTKPSDLFNKTGTSGASGSKPNPFAPIPALSTGGDKPADEKEAAKRLMDNLTDDGSSVTKKRDLGHGVHADARAKGGAGAASQRPKV